MCQWQEPSCLNSCAHKSPSKFWKQISWADKSKINYQSDEITNSGKVKRCCASDSDVQNGSAASPLLLRTWPLREATGWARAKDNTCHRYQKYNRCGVTIRKTVSLSTWFQKRLFHDMCWRLKRSLILQSSLTLPSVNAPGPGTRGRFAPIGVMVKMHVGAKAENTPGWGASSSQGPKISLNIVLKV